MADPATPEPLAQKPKKTKKLLILGLGLLLVLGGAIGSIITFAPGLLPVQLSGAKDAPTEKKEAHKEIQGHIYSTEAFLVNLADAEHPRYLKVKIDLESNEERPNEEYEKRLPQLRDAILTVLSSKTYQEVFDSEGKKKLKEEIILKTNEVASKFKIKTVYFTEFVVQ